MQSLTSIPTNPSKKLLVIAAILGAFAQLLHMVPGTTQAQVTPSGLNTAVSPSGTVYEIRGGTRSADNLNLFHGFGEFSLGTVESAKFFNDPVAPTTSNIFGRVTGGLPSNILGTIDSATEFPGANLWLINPAGIMFGAGATLNVGGSAHFSTADYLLLRDDLGTVRTFSASTQAGDLMTWSFTSAPVEAFGFLGPNAASIAIQGSTLQVQEGQTVSLIGGNRQFETATGEEMVPSGVTMTGGTLSAPSGRVQLASVDSAGEVIVKTVEQAEVFNVDSFARLGRVVLSDGAVISASTPLDADFFPISDSGNGVVRIRGGQLIMDTATIEAHNFGILDGEPTAVDIEVQSDLSLNNSSIQAVTLDAGGGNIAVKAESLSLMDSNISTSSFVAGTGGKIDISTSGLLTVAGSFIGSFSESSGDGGAMNISAGSIFLNEGRIESRSSEFVTAGDISLQVDGDLSVVRGGAIEAAASSGVAGNISITAGGNVSVSGQLDDLTPSRILSGSASGGSGNIDITARNFLLADGALIDSNSVSQQGGNVTIQADSVTVSGVDSRILMRVVSAPGGVVEISSPSINIVDNGSIRTRTGGIGDAGVIRLDGRNVTISNSQVTADSLSGSGRGGDVTIIAIDNLSLSGQFTDVNGSTSPSGVFSRAFSTGDGGNITITAGQSVTMTNGATITASSTGLGNAGNIFIKGVSANGVNTFLMENSSITTQAAQASGGKIDIKASDMVRLINSQINTSVADGTGGGGDITIDPNFVILQNSQILANAFAGPGGNITITTQVFLPDASSIVDASSQFGVNGTVTIQSPTSNLSAVWARLQQNYTEAAALLRARCAAQVSGQYSSFVQTGRDAVPLEPGGWMLSPLAALSAGEGPGARGEGNVGSETEPVSLRGFNQNLSWPGLVQAPRRFVSILDSACGS